MRKGSTAGERIPSVQDVFLTVKNVGSEMVQESFSTKVYSTVKLNVFLRIMRIWHAASMQRGHHESLRLKGSASLRARIMRIQPEDDLAGSSQRERRFSEDQDDDPVCREELRIQ